MQMNKKSTVLILLLAVSMISMIPLLSTKTVAAVPITPSTSTPAIQWLNTSAATSLLTAPSWLNLETSSIAQGTITPVTIEGTDTYGQNIEATCTVPANTQEQTLIFNDTHTTPQQPVVFASITGIYQQNGTDNTQFTIGTQPYPFMQYLGEYHTGTGYYAGWLPGQYTYGAQQKPNIYGPPGRYYLVGTGAVQSHAGETPSNPGVKNQSVPVEPAYPMPLVLYFNWHETDGNLLPAASEIYKNSAVGHYWIAITGLDEKGNPMTVNMTITSGVPYQVVAPLNGHTWSTICTVIGDGPDSYYIFTYPATAVWPLFTYTLLIDHMTIQPASYDIMANPNDTYRIDPSPTTVPLGTAAYFSVLAGSGITNTGTTTITADAGTYPTTTESGFTGANKVIFVDGINHYGDSVTQGAKGDLLTAYNDAAGQTAVTVPTELGGHIMTPGVYNSTSGTFGITGTLVLNGSGNPNSVFIFQTASTLITAAGSAATPASVVSLTNDAQACNVFWQVGSSATIGTYSTFVGNILAYTSITVNTGATVDGRVLALHGATTLQSNTINTTDYDNIVLAPASATNPVGTNHTVTATVGGTGNPQPGLNITFNVVSGPNAPKTGWNITRSNGQASFTYTSNGIPGIDNITASFVNSQGATVTSNQVTKIWLSAGPAIGVQKYVSVDDGKTWLIANAAPGPTILAGLNVYYKFVVTNVGSVELTDISLSDSPSLSFIGSIQSSLASGANFTVTAGPVKSDLCLNKDIATAIGYYSETPYTSTATAYYYGIPSSPLGMTNITVALVDQNDNLINCGANPSAFKDGAIEVNFATSGGKIQPSNDVWIPPGSNSATTTLYADTNPRTVNVTALALVPACYAGLHPAESLFAWTEMTFDGVSSVGTTWTTIHEMMWGWNSFTGTNRTFSSYTGPVPPKPVYPQPWEVPTVGGTIQAAGAILDGPVYEVMIPLYVGCNLISCPVRPIGPPGNTLYQLSCGMPMDLLFGNNSATTNIEAVWWYSNGTWYNYIPGVSVQTNQFFQDGVGYWVYAEKPCTIEISGVIMDDALTPPVYTVSPGWNLVGLTSITPVSIDDFLSYTPYSSPVWTYYAYNGIWFMDPSWGLYPGYGFWVYNAAS